MAYSHAVVRSADACRPNCSAMSTGKVAAVLVKNVSIGGRCAVDPRR